MFTTLSWLKEYVDIMLQPEQLAEKLTEVGLGVENIKKENGEVVLELEVTPNRPDWQSMLGIAREIAAIEGKSIKYPKLLFDPNKTKSKKTLPLTIKTNHEINPRITGIIIDGITVKQSPQWLKQRLESIGQRSINNIVDVTNYIMFELGNPIHAFDYDKIQGHVMHTTLSKGGEEFKSVDGISYRLPKDAIIIYDSEKIIDLCGIKGGYNSGTNEDTKTIFIRVPVEDPVLIRKASQTLGLRSEASSIFERGVNREGTIDALRRTVDLVLELAGGEVASELIDIKKGDFKPWNLKMDVGRLKKLLGIDIDEKKVVNILTSLNLNPNPTNKDTIEVTVPTYRNDLQIEEDIIEEVARHYGYNNFPKTLPHGEIPLTTIPYFRDFEIENRMKQFIKGTGFSEIYTYSLVSELDIRELDGKVEEAVRVDNPVSREYEYLRPTLTINLRKAVKQNLPFESRIELFELGKMYKRVGKEFEETVALSGISNKKSFFEIKGLLERLFKEFSINNLSKYQINIVDEGVMFEMSFTEMLEKMEKVKTFKPLPKYPPIVEDIAFVVDKKIRTDEIIREIQKVHSLISDVTLLDIYQNSRTFHIVYQDPERNLTSDDVKPIREKVMKIVSEKFKAEVK